MLIPSTLVCCESGCLLRTESRQILMICSTFESFINTYLQIAELSPGDWVEFEAQTGKKNLAKTL